MKSNLKFYAPFLLASLILIPSIFIFCKFGGKVKHNEDAGFRPVSHQSREVEEDVPAIDPDLEELHSTPAPKRHKHRRRHHREY